MNSLYYSKSKSLQLGWLIFCTRITLQLSNTSQHQAVTREAPKISTFLYALTLPDINRFSKLFHSQNQEKICNNAIAITKCPTTHQVCRYTTL